MVNKDPQVAARGSDRNEKVDNTQILKYDNEMLISAKFYFSHIQSLHIIRLHDFTNDIC